MNTLIEHLLRPEAFDHPVEQFEVLQTHISWVILTGPYAYKIKKPVHFGFVDFRFLEQRRACCEEELRLNRRLACGLYVAVRPIMGPVDSPSLVVSGANDRKEIIDFAVQMRQFPQTQLLPAVLERGELTARHIDQLADRLAAFHAQIEVARPDDPFGEAATLHEQMEDNLRVLRKTDVAGALSAIEEWIENETRRLEPWFHKRKWLGRIRECHGDLHLGNMVFLDDRIEMFDCLEFNPQLRWIDVIDEIAFLAMDLTERGKPDLAARVLNRWLEQTGDYQGLAGWRWYFVYRALVRAKVTAIRLMQQDEPPTSEVRSTLLRDLQRYIELAAEQTRPRPMSVVITHGVSGTGKSHLAIQLAGRTGAIRLRSDVERKRLFGLWGTPRTEIRTGDPYRAEVTDEIYREVLPDLGRQILATGFPVIIDATFLRRRHRASLRGVAKEAGVPFVVLDLVLDQAIARSRIMERHAQGGDPSDADVVVLDQQLSGDEPLSAEERSEAILVDGPNPDIEKLTMAIRSRSAPAPSLPTVDSPC